MAKAEDLVRLAGVVARRMSRVTTEDARSLESSVELSALMEVLELFVPRVLREDYPEWELESLDGFLVSSFQSSAEGLVTLAGLAILISDQTVTPFHVALHPAADRSLGRAEILLGERGGGALGISGPICTAASVPNRLERLVPRLSHVEWVYRAAYIKRDGQPPGDS